MSKYRAEPIDPGATADGFLEWDAHPLRGGFAARLYPTVAPAHRDISFQVTGPSGPVVRVRATLGPDQVSLWGLPAVLAWKPDAEPRHIKDGLATALDHLTETAARGGASRLVIGGAAEPACDPLAALLVDRGAEGTVQASAMVDLHRPAEALRADIRDSYRSLTNWGSRNLTLSFVNAANPDRAAFDLFPDFHARIAGGRRRDEAYWQVYWNEIAQGRAEMVLGFLPPENGEDGTLAAGSLVVWAGSTAYYASGVYDRDKFDKPLGHWPLWNTILRAREAGLSAFDLGEIPPRGHADDKEISIAFFKRGFTSGRSLRVKWVIGV
ncbi:GNAT family N-acetyltransferase [Magnetospirillum sp. 15-1]|uniref:GNAT family N-acetyltransferase n=1 Tax=Magnetospirillum sp. 15-1 TaxID=1979370 RepID=UPI000BBBB6CB|nr:GNAT family N-acetyltransferase [Magnetospirillum sp. 15-1]